MQEFKSIDELYNRVKPALYSKVQEFKRNHVSYIKEVDIWNYLSTTSWKRAESLSLGEMVSQIMSLSLTDMQTYVHDILRKQDREITGDGETLL